jgi:hypothetical protein
MPARPGVRNCDTPQFSCLAATFDHLNGPRCREDRKSYPIPPIDWLYEALCTEFGVAAPVAAHFGLARMGLLPASGLAVPRRRSHTIPEPVMDPEAHASRVVG